MPSAPLPGDAGPVVVARAPGVAGGELVLRRDGGHFEIISNGVFLMDTRDGSSEREMVRACLAAVPERRRGVRVLIGGLGVGFSARAALADARVDLVRVVELEPAVIEWHHGPLGGVAGHLPTDPRCDLVCADLVTWIGRADGAADPGYDVACLDVDNGPGWTVTEGNERLYEPEALVRLGSLLRPGGAVAFWSATRAPAFAALLEERFGGVRTVEVPARRGEPDVIYLASVARRG